MYNAVPSGCKAYVELTGGGHCNFANSNFNCSFGELTCGGAGSLGRPPSRRWHSSTPLWLDRYLKDDAQAGADLEALLLAGAGHHGAVRVHRLPADRGAGGTKVVAGRPLRWSRPT